MLHKGRQCPAQYLSFVHLGTSLGLSQGSGSDTTFPYSCGNVFLMICRKFTVPELRNCLAFYLKHEPSIFFKLVSLLFWNRVSLDVAQAGPGLVCYVA